MTSAGERNRMLAGHLRLLNVRREALGEDLETALAGTPEEYRSDLRALIEAEQREVRMFYRTGASVVDGGPRAWFDSWDPNAGYYWRRLRQYLIDRKGWSPRDVDDLNQSSNNVLRHIEDARTDGPYSRPEFRVQGLVLGYVQSGKTAHFTSLIAKAADRGYQLIVVLSGVHNSLRAQTQRRLDLELGLVADPKGVGRPDREHVWWAITKADLKGDFSPNTDAGPIATGSRGVMVIKKNATVLRRLVKWLEDGDVPADLPVLIIDDEADQASINTVPEPDEVDLGDDTGDFPPDKELDPSTINGLIRQLIEQFQRVSYVAYTATPFANVLINPDAESDRFGYDLFPRDFIISLPRPAAYVGAERIFGRPALDDSDDEVTGLDVVRIVPVEELAELVPRGKAASAAWEPVVTESLRAAMLDWLLATAGKVHRLGEGMSTMLVHTTQRIIQQNELSDVVQGELNLLRSRWRHSRESIRPELIERWNTDFRPVTVSLNADWDVPFSAIGPHLDYLLGPGALQMLVLNSESPDLLDYESNPSLKVLLIGGNRLSRGLTLEDLTVSFYVREAATYDTLLQMGRWFGYRGKFVDLTRLWTTETLVSRFRHLALVEEDLRDQIKIYERDNLTPVQMAPKIRSHPDMLVVARNRMGSAESVRQSYAGQLIQMTRFQLGDDDWLEHNLRTTRALLNALGRPNGAPNGRDGRPAWTGIPWEYIEGFLQNFRTAQDAMSFDAVTAARYIRVQAEKHRELTNWAVAVQSGLRVNPDLGTCDLNIVGAGPVAAINRSQLKADSLSVGALVSPAREDNLAAADESVDLNADQIARATATADTFPNRGHALRAQRAASNGLLLIYPISPNSKPGSNAVGDNRRPLFATPRGRPFVIGIALSFPPSTTGATVEYLGGKPSVHAVGLTEDIG